MDTFSKAAVENLIRTYGQVDYIEKGIKGYDVWVLDNGVVIRLPADNSRLPESYVFSIAEVKLDLSTWEYDYWISQQ